MSFGFVMGIALVCVFIAFVVGAGIGLALGRREKPKPAVVKPQNIPPPVQVQKPVRGILLSRDSSTGKLCVEWDGKLIPAIENLTNEQLQELRQVGREWFTWLSGGQGQGRPTTPARENPPAAQVPATPPVVLPAEKPAATTGFQVDPLESRLKTVVNQVANGAKVPGVTPIVTPIKQDLISAVLPEKVASAASTPSAAPLSMVGQIDEILQGLLKNSSISSKAIKLLEDPRKGVVVWIGLEHYEGIDAVPDPEVKNLIRAAAKEWEQKNEKK
jgi:hypothetical protein